MGKYNSEIIYKVILKEGKIKTENYYYDFLEAFLKVVEFTGTEMEIKFISKKGEKFYFEITVGDKNGIVEFIEII